VTETIARAQPGAPATETPRRGSLVVAAVTGAAGAAALGLLGSLSCVLMGWATDSRSSGSASSLLRAAGQLWVMAHRTPVRVPAGRVVLAPLGLTLIMLTLVARAAAAAVRRTATGTRRDVVIAGLAVAPPYALVVTVVAGLSGVREVQPSPVGALLSALALSGTAAIAGVVRVRGWAWIAEPFPPVVAAIAPASAAAVATMLATGGLLAAAALAASGSTSTALSRAVAPGAPAAVALLLAQVALVPNAVVWASSYALGSGFAVGVGTAVAPAGVHLGAVPALPLLAALPAAGSAPPASLAALLGPLLAGAVAGVILGRRLGGSPPARVAQWMLVAAIVTGTAMATLAWIAGGSGPGRLAALGPPPLLVWAAAAGWVAMGGVPAAWVVARRYSAPLNTTEGGGT
jgi:hypothetical protein